MIEMLWLASSLAMGLMLLSLMVVLLRYGSKKEHYLWAIFNFMVGIWGLNCFIASFIRDSSLGLLIWKIALLGGIVSPAIFYHLLTVLSNVKKKIPVTIFYTFCATFCLLVALGLAKFNVVYIFNSLQYLHVGNFLFVFLILGWVVIVLSIYIELIGLFRRSVGDKRIQFTYFLVATFIGFTGGIMCVVMMFDKNTLPLGNLLICIYWAICTYAIFRHQLLDIRVIIKKTLVFTGLLAFVFAILIIPTLIIQEYLFRNTGFTGKFIGLSISGTIIILTMRRIENFIINITDKYLFQKKYDYKELLRTFTSEVLTVLELDKLLNLTKDKLKEIVKLEFCDIIMFDGSNREHAMRRDKIDKKEELSIPLTIDNEPIGILLLGKKKSDELYMQDDMDILVPLAKTLAIAISNARLFEELGKTQAEAAQKEKMATIGTLAAGMAHEIRNPITTIKIFSDYLPDKINEAGFVSKYKNIVVKEVDKIDHIIQTMIDFSGDAVPSEVENVSLNEVIDELITLMSLSLELVSRVEFMKDIPPLLPDIRVNRKELDEIMLNLTQNAINAIRGKGLVTFQAKEGIDHILLSIKDTGCGMSEDTLKHIFSPFFTTRLKGFGLGLFVVNDLVKRNNGKIAVESKVGAGTTFKLEFQKA